MRSRLCRRIITVLAVVLFLAGGGVAKAQSISFIRDAEVENTIRAYMAPLLTAAGVDPASVNLFLVGDRRINAFVAGGMNLFINVGLLLQSDKPGEVIGVLAHEIGHIANGHILRARSDVRSARFSSLLTYILGAAAAIAGSPAVGNAIVLGGQRVAIGNLLRHSVAREEQADQAAMRFLDATHQSAGGFLDLLEKLADQELLPARRQVPYARTHPITADRIAFVRHHLEGSPYADARPAPGLVLRHQRMFAKLHAFLDPPRQTLRRYPKSDKSLPARYARAIAYYRIPELKRALAEIDGLIAEHPKDPYFHELKGQMLFENAHLKEAVKAYRRAVALAPDEPLLHFGLARAELETGDEAMVESAVSHLERVVRAEPRNPGFWHQLGIAYGRAGKLARADLALAEEALLRGQSKEASQRAKRAAKHLPAGSPSQLRARDILREAKRASG